MGVEHRLAKRCIQHKEVPGNYRKNSNYPDYIQPNDSGGGLS